MRAKAKADREYFTGLILSEIRNTFTAHRISSISQASSGLFTAGIISMGFFLYIRINFPANEFQEFQINHTE